MPGKGTRVIIKAVCDINVENINANNNNIPIDENSIIENNEEAFKEEFH